jgi:hypothetical protein
MDGICCWLSTGYRNARHARVKGTVLHPNWADPSSMGYFVRYDTSRLCHKLKRSPHLTFSFETVAGNTTDRTWGRLSVGGMYALLVREYALPCCVVCGLTNPLVSGPNSGGKHNLSQAI